MKKLIGIILLLCGLSTFIYADNSSYWEDFSRVYYKKDKTPGYIFFEGFDFNGYKAESDGIEPMLEKTLGGNE